MKNFSDLKIELNRFEGKKISIDDVVDKPIDVLDFKIEPSNYKDKGNNMRLTLSIKHEGVKRVIFTSSVILQEQCEKVREVNAFPFKATIKRLIPRGYKFE